MAPVILPPDLDSHLSLQESVVPGLIPDSRKAISWAGVPGARTPLSLVYVHGWQGSSRDYEAVLQRVASRLGANVYYSRLAGYGVTSDAILKVSLRYWLHDTREAYEIGRRIGDRVIVAGSSMGGDLSLWLAAQDLPGIAALVLLSCAVQPKDRRSEMLLWPWPLPRIILRAVVGKYNMLRYNSQLYPNGSPELFARLYPPRYRAESTIRLMAAVKMVRSLPLESISVPSLWLYSEKDDSVDIPTLKRFYARMGGSQKRLVHVDGARSHMLAGDVFSPETNDEVSGAIQSFLGEAGIAP
jgi:pimeloyl-ACP methyl ester carboxylesterase